MAWYEIERAGISGKVDAPGMGAYAVFGPNNEYWIGYDLLTPVTKQG